MSTIPQRPLWRVYLVFLVPMVLSNILQGLSGTLNGIFIGQIFRPIPEDRLAAARLQSAGPVTALLTPAIRLSSTITATAEHTVSSFVRGPRRVRHIASLLIPKGKVIERVIPV